MKKILKYIRPYSTYMMFGFLIKILATAMDLIIPLILAYIIDDIIPTKNLKHILMLGALMILCSFASAFFNITANRIAAFTARNSTENIRHDLFEKILNLSNKQIDKIGIPSLISRMTTDTYNVNSMMGLMQRMGVRAPILLLGGIIITSMLDMQLTLVLIFTLPFIIAIAFSVTKKAIPLYIKQQNASDKLVMKLRESITGIRVIKALSKSEYEKEMFDEINKDAIRCEKKASMTALITNPSVAFVLNTGLAIIILLGAHRVNRGLVEVGVIIAFLTYFTIILNAVMAMTRIFVIYSKAGASANRIVEILELEEDMFLSRNFGNIVNVENPENYHIEFNNVSFSYDGIENNLSNISFKLKKGEALGIIGSTGAGKSTIINLLMRFYDADSGEILIDGINIKNMSKKELRQNFGAVFQNDMIFAKSIKENITLNREASDTEIANASSYAQAKEFINDITDGYDSDILIKGSNLSGGQKQRILIARALLCKPKILILDDSSSALDYKTDALLRKALSENFKETTKIIIAQRISAVKNLEHIMVLEDGMIVGYGTHQELMDSCEIYKEISNSLMGGCKCEI